MGKNKAKKATKEKEVVIDKDVTKKDTAEVQPQKPEVKVEKPETKQEPKVDKKTEKSSAEAMVEKTEKQVAQIMIPTAQVGSGTESMPSSEALLATVMMQKYYTNPALQKDYPELYSQLSRSIDAVVLLGLVKVRRDLQKNGSSLGLKLSVPAEQVMPLMGMAQMLGIELESGNMIESKTGEQQMEIDFNKAKVDPLLEEEGTIVEEAEDTVELDPQKIETKEQLKAALSTLFNGKVDKNRTIIDELVKTLVWYDKYLFADRVSAEDKLKNDKLSLADKLNQILSIIKPNGLFSGIGSYIHSLTAMTGSPVGGYCILKKHMPADTLNDDEIADLLKGIVSNVAIEKNAARDAKDKIDVEKEDKAVMAMSSVSVEKIEETLSEEYAHKGQIEGIIRTILHPNEKNVRKNEIIEDIISIYNKFRTEKLDPEAFMKAPAKKETPKAEPAEEKPAQETEPKKEEAKVEDSPKEDPKKEQKEEAKKQPQPQQKGSKKK